MKSMESWKTNNSNNSKSEKCASHKGSKLNENVGFRTFFGARRKPGGGHNRILLIFIVSTTLQLINYIVLRNVQVFSNTWNTLFVIIWIAKEK